jgi:hypothetical protein
VTGVTGPTYPKGSPCWFDMTVAHLAAAEDFYRSVFGWEFEPNQWRYEKALVAGRAVAALGEGRPEGAPAWTTCLATDDVAATSRLVQREGGTPVREPHDVPGGRLAVVAEPAGGVFGLWQGTSLLGSGAFGEPGAPHWAEASSREPSGTADFLSAVFGLAVRRPFPGYGYA